MTIVALVNAYRFGASSAERGPLRRSVSARCSAAEPAAAARLSGTIHMA